MDLSSTGQTVRLVGPGSPIDPAERRDRGVGGCVGEDCRNSSEVGRVRVTRTVDKVIH